MEAILKKICPLREHKWDLVERLRLLFLTENKEIIFIRIDKTKVSVSPDNRLPNEQKYSVSYTIPYVTETSTARGSVFFTNSFSKKELEERINSLSEPQQQYVLVISKEDEKDFNNIMKNLK